MGSQWSLLFGVFMAPPTSGPANGQEHRARKEQWLGQDYRAGGVGPQGGADRSWGKPNGGYRRKRGGWPFDFGHHQEGTMKFPQGRVRDKSILLTEGLAGNNPQKF